MIPPWVRRSRIRALYWTWVGVSNSGEILRKGGNGYGKHESQESKNHQTVQQNC